jgi:hypothetical protein
MSPVVSEKVYFAESVDTVVSCLPGQRISVHSASGCEYCTSGEASNGQTDVCHGCSAGLTGDPRVHYFNSWPVDEWPDDAGTFGSSCTGPCFIEYIYIMHCI